MDRLRLRTRGKTVSEAALAGSSAIVPRNVGEAPYLPESSRGALRHVPR